MKKIVIIVLILILGMVSYFGYLGYLARAAQDTTLLQQQITSGSLSITAPTSVSFAAKAYSFTGQNSTGNTLSNVQPLDETGSQNGWGVAATCGDWTASALTMDYDGDGSSTGQLTINSSSATCTATFGDTNGVTVGSTDAFSATTTTITIITASNGNGDGSYDCDGWDLQQFIPGSQQAGTYTTTLTIDLT